MSDEIDEFPAFFLCEISDFCSPFFLTPGSGPREPVPLARRRWIPIWQNRPDPRFGWRYVMGMFDWDVSLGDITNSVHEVGF